MPDSENEQARAQLLGDLQRYFIGPCDENERIEVKASERYHTGFLSPAGERIDEEEDDQKYGNYDPESGDQDNVLTLANVSRQSAVGMTFHVRSELSQLVLRVRWATYRAENNSEKVNDDDPDLIWVRHPFDEEIRFNPTTVNGPPDGILVHEDVKVLVAIRTRDGFTTITASVVNRKPQTRDKGTDNNIYQVGIVATAPGGDAVFTARPPSSYVLDEEFWNFELLYRDARQFAVGHGISANWLSEDGRTASRIYTEWIPQAEVFKASADVLQDDPILLLSSLTDPNRRVETCEALYRLPAEYMNWIRLKREGIASLLDEFPAGHREQIRKAAEQNLDNCERAVERITRGIDFLKESDESWRAFCLACEAMALSMRKTRPDDEPRWYAFQLAFILLAIPSTADETHPDRKILDLIWFPTGGGKSEAYLGLASFTLFLRRINAKTPEDGLGTSVFTRYTLRLLTVQQFERAARVICACELVYQNNRAGLGPCGFSIGLFVGSAATPNDMAKAKQILDGLDEDEEDEGLSTLPIKDCPWCGTTLLVSMQKIEAGRLVTRCPNSACDFHDGVPIIVVDEELYEFPASMVVGTIDKFARMAWEPRIRSIFGRGTPKRPPPDLIIQDELHLIGDSLGTIAALYEAAIDYLCTRNGAGPKIVGSTATIRRAEEQCKDLFIRDAVQFPPSGTEATDSFFYREDKNNPGRLYVGIHAQGRSPKHTWAWLVGTLSQCVESLTPPRIKDTYYTLISYFNSLRELGGSLVMAEDDVPRHMKSMTLPEGQTVRELIQKKELTSHLPSSMISDMLKELQTPLIELQQGEDAGEYEPLDLVLATNMISVGVDVDRLGLMLVNGQPKTTAEYIQATSRIGRRRGDAGLVVTLYNWARPRDRSHYENFVNYHKAFYRHVEATSVTPFSNRARGRALHAVLVSLARMMMDELTENDSAISINRSEIEAEIRAFIEVLVERAIVVDQDEATGTRADLESNIEDWLSEAADRVKLSWAKSPRSRTTFALLRWGTSNNDANGLWPTPNSMRDVEPPSPVRLLTQRELRRTSGNM